MYVVFYDRYINYSMLQLQYAMLVCWKPWHPLDPPPKKTCASPAAPWDPSQPSIPLRPSEFNRICNDIILRYVTVYSNISYIVAYYSMI